MPPQRPRHLARPRWPWRLLLIAFELTFAVLAALVASATLLPPQAPAPQRAPGVALPTITTEPALTSLTTTTQQPTPRPPRQPAARTPTRPLRAGRSPLPDDVPRPT